MGEIQYSQVQTMINHSDRCFTHLGDLDISFVLFNISSIFFLHLVSVTKAKIKILFVSPFPTDPIKFVRPWKFYWREKKKRKFFRFRSGNERKLFVQFQFGILLELRMTSLKVISKSNNNDGHHMVCRCCRKPERLKKTLISNALKKIGSKNTCYYICKIWMYLI